MPPFSRPSDPNHEQRLLTLDPKTWPAEADDVGADLCNADFLPIDVETQMHTGRETLLKWRFHDFTRYRTQAA